MSSPFSGTMQVKLIDQGLNDFGTQGNPLFTASSTIASIDSIKSISSTNTAAGSYVVVPGIANKKTAVFALSIFTSTGVNATINFTDGTGGSVLFSALVVSTNQNSLNFSQTVGLPNFLFCTSLGNDLAVNLSANVTGVVNVSYFTL